MKWSIDSKWILNTHLLCTILLVGVGLPSWLSNGVQSLQPPRPGYPHSPHKLLLVDSILAPVLLLCTGRFLNATRQWQHHIHWLSGARHFNCRTLVFLIPLLLAVTESEFVLVIEIRSKVLTLEMQKLNTERSYNYTKGIIEGFGPYGFKPW